MKLELKKFNMNQLRDDSVVVVIGKRNTGKSWIMRDIMHRHRDFPVGVCISPTESSNHFYGKFIPEMLIYDKYQPGVIKKFLDRQKKIMAQKDYEIATYGSSSIDPRAFLLLDDMMYDTSWIKDDNIRWLFFNGRHTKAFLAINLQFSLGLPPVLRSNIDYVFICRETYINNRKRLYEHYAGMFDSFETFCQVLDVVTNNYGTLVIDNVTKSNKLEDQVFWYRAADREDFKVCSEEFWTLQAIENEKRAGIKKPVDLDEDEEDRYDPKLLRKKNKIQLNVTTRHD